MYFHEFVSCFKEFVKSLIYQGIIARIYDLSFFFLIHATVALKFVKKLLARSGELIETSSYILFILSRDKFKPNF